MPRILLCSFWYMSSPSIKHPSNIISDHGKYSISHFWGSLCQLLGIKANLSTVYHPETDRQTEWDNWKHLLPLAEFAYNNTQHSATSVTPFFANKGFHPKLKVSLESVPLESAHEMATNVKDLHQYLCDQLQLTIKQYEHHSANWHLPIPGFKAGDSVWLDAQNIKTKCPSKKLDHRHLGPFPIVEMVSSHAA